MIRLARLNCIAAFRQKLSIAPTLPDRRGAEPGQLPGVAVIPPALLPMRHARRGRAGGSWLCLLGPTSVAPRVGIRYTCTLARAGEARECRGFCLPRAGTARREAVKGRQRGWR